MRRTLTYPLKEPIILLDNAPLKSMLETERKRDELIIIELAIKPILSTHHEREKEDDRTYS